MQAKPYIEARGIMLVRTCDACPEQYDAFDGTGRLAGYVRLRFGKFAVHAPNHGGAVVLSASIGDGLTGQFTDDEERRHWLLRAIDAIKDRK